MIQLKVLTGKKAGSTIVARRFPFQIGRGAGANLRLEDAGVWDRHLELSLTPEGFFLQLETKATAMINGDVIRHQRLRNGDLIELGAVKMQFWLSETRQSSLRLREILSWLALGFLALSEVYLAYYLTP